MDISEGISSAREARRVGGPNLVLLILHERLVAETVHADHVFGGVAVRVEHARPVDHHSASVSVPPRRREDEALLQELGDIWNVHVKV